jgi:hypothetical protein
VRKTNKINDYPRTSIAGSHGSVDAAGIPQSTTPGMGDGRRSSRIFVSSFEDRSLDRSSETVEELDASACVAGGDGVSVSSANLERGLGLVWTGRRMMI